MSRTAIRRRAAHLVAFVALVMTGCSDGSPADEAATTFESFQRAVVERDRTALRRTLTSESRPVVDHLLEVEPSPPLTVEAVVEVDRTRRDVIAREAAAGSTSRWVVVREAGAWRVDLVESTALQNGVIHDSGMRIERGVTTDEIDGFISDDSGGVK